ncbi:hypothetical protein I5Q34_32615 [Streptomyces sp. AV19]|uniref:hypothetical protein n=1 Tax=Streptomyces sp. AV19 TaxID=2793068 RepID=UPI0018FE8CEA|nr:hypothetical protein [Streptomyces sp. AV19]MBH1938950.1 hypothetical protein [Streptomyces sp. AV19]MDG4531640.1 hypothetical protein [Streptomyces sp. AV19]
MNRTARRGTLVGAVAMSVLGLVGTSAAPALAQDKAEVPSATSVKDFFKPGDKIPDSIFKPGAKLTIKRNVEGSPRAAAPSLARSGVTDMGESCGTNVIQKTSGSGKTTLVMTVSKEVAVQKSASGGVDWGIVSAQVGFSVTRTYKVENQTRFEVPRGKYGTIEAYPLYHHYRVNLPIAGYAEIYKPIGVCFNQWAN